MRIASASLCAVGLLLSACALKPATSSAPAPSAESAVEAGRRFTEQNCSRCHAIGVVGASVRVDAPPLRDLYKRYPLDALRAAFLNGLHVGHADMPTFRLSREETNAVLSYLRSIDPCAQPSSDKAAMERCFAPL